MANQHEKSEATEAQKEEAIQGWIADSWNSGGKVDQAIDKAAVHAGKAADTVVRESTRFSLRSIKFLGMVSVAGFLHGVEESGILAGKALRAVEDEPAKEETS